MAVPVEPPEELADFPRRQADAGVRGTVIQVDRVTVVAERVAAWERDVPNIAFAFVGRLGTENPGIAAQQAVLRRFQIEAAPLRAGTDSRPLSAGRRDRASAIPAVSR